MSKLLFLLFSISVVISVGIFCIYEKVKSKVSDDKLIVRIDQGLLRGGKRRSTLNNIEYYAFKGIPYAKPPVGSLRFKDPEPAEPWHGIFDATKEVTECPQINFIKKQTGYEDCLQLNVYTPQFLDKKVKRYPVMVWIHGGGFTYNSAVEDAYGAGLLIEHGVVLVSLNYRVGAFGFLNMLNQHVPGNAGLKDQVLALKWVKHNIYNFGGDPLDITIFGESAGSASVQYHTLSPLSQGLFHRIIMESGSALNPWAFTEEPRVRAFQLGKLLSFNGTDDNELIEYLQKIPADELIEAQNQIINNEYAKQCLDFPFLPSIEVKGTGSNFLTEHPRSLLERGEFAHVPAIIGINSKEGILSLTDAFKTKKDYGDYYGNFIPEELHLVNGSEKYNELADEIKAFFFYNKPVDVNNLDAFTNVCGDIAFVIGIYETINYFLNYSDSVYIYEFTFEGKLGFLRKAIQSMRPDLKVPAGVSHADELGYIFPSKKIKYLDTSSPELKIVHVMTNMWTKFAKTSTPTEKINASFYWEPASKEKLNHLDINNPLKLEGTIFLPERITFWDDILENTHLNNNQQNVLYNASVQ